MMGNALSYSPQKVLKQNISRHFCCQNLFRIHQKLRILLTCILPNVCFIANDVYIFYFQVCRQEWGPSIPGIERSGLEIPALVLLDYLMFLLVPPRHTDNQQPCRKFSDSSGDISHAIEFFFFLISNCFRWKSCTTMRENNYSLVLHLIDILIHFNLCITRFVITWFWIQHDSKMDPKNV